MMRHRVRLRLISCLFAAAVLAGPAYAQDVPHLRGVNISGAEYGNKAGKAGTNYIYPTSRDVGYFLDKGFNVIRLPFKWVRLQPTLNGPLSIDELGRIRTVVSLATDRNAYVVLDPHDYGAYDGKLIGSPEVPSQAFADFWAKLAGEFAGNPRVVFGLMNEPIKIDSVKWRDISQEAVNAIRQKGARNLILVPGIAWTGAHSWFSSGNAAAMEDLRDPVRNMAFEFHQYLDADFSGTKDTCPNPQAGANAIRRVSDWLQQGGRRGFLGEFGAPANDPCLQGLDLMLSEMDRRQDLWMGWAYWAAGAWWPKDYPMSVQPIGGQDRPQMNVLMKYLD